MSLPDTVKPRCLFPLGAGAFAWVVVAVARSLGRTGHRYRQACERLRVPGAVCCLCWRPIDITLRFPDRWSWTLQHLDGNKDNNDPRNHGSAHLTCNSSQGAKARWDRQQRRRRRSSREW